MDFIVENGHLKTPEVEIFLCKPNRSIIGKVKDRYDTKYSLKYGKTNELSFVVPRLVEREHELVENKLFNQFRIHYLLKVLFNGETQWFMLTNPKTVGSSDTEVKEIQAYSLEYELSKKNIREWAGVLIGGEYRKESLNARQVLESLLSSSTWGLDYIDSKFLTTYRSFEFTSTTVIDAIYKVAETFNAVTIWDTVNQTLSLYQPKLYGANEGLRFSYRKYLKEMSIEEDSTEIVTRLKVFGQDGISINRVNATGTNYIEDYSFYMYPFERDNERNTIKSSYYMSDSLCNAILDYQEFVNSKQEIFKNHLESIDSLNIQLDTLYNELFDLQTELIRIQDEIEILRANGEDTSSKKSEEQLKIAEVENKVSEIDNIDSQISVTQGEINTLSSELSVENNFTKEQIKEWNFYINEKEWENTYISNEETLLEAGKEVFEEYMLPISEFNIDVVNFLKISEYKRDWKKFKLGARVNIYYEQLDKYIEAQIMEFDFSEDSNDLNIKISNTKDLSGIEEKIRELFKNSVSTSTQINMNKHKWNDIANVSNTVSEIIQNSWDTAKNAVIAGTNESVTIDRTGVTLSDSNDPNRFIRMNHGVIGITIDGGNTYKTAILPDRIVAEQVLGKLIAGNNLVIENESGLYRIDQDGMTIENGALNIIGGIDRSNISDEFWGEVETEISEASKAIDELEKNVNDIFSDSKITQIEASTLERLLIQAESESTDLITASNALSITTEKTDYSNAVTELRASMTGFIGKDSEEYPLEISSSQRSDINGEITNVNSTKSILINKIAEVREQRAKNASVGKGELINGVRIGSDNGLTITRSDDNVKATFNSTEGILIEKKEGSSWKRKLYADTNGNLTVEDLIANRLIMRNGNDVLIDGNTRTINFDNFHTKVGKLTADNIDATSLTVTNANITGVLTADRLNLKQNLLGTNVAGNLVIGADGSVTIRGNIYMEGGSITWTGVNTPSASQVGARPNNWTPNAYEVGAKPSTYSAMDDVGAYLTNITPYGIYTGTLSADNIEGGTIRGVTIDVSTTATVGNTLYLGSSSSYGTTKRLYFNNSANIQGGTGYAGADVSINADVLQINAKAKFNGGVEGLSLTAKFG